MNRRNFLTWLGIAWLATVTPIFIATLLHNKQKSYQTTQQPLIFYVAPDGKDIYSGTLPQTNADATDGAFATIAQARDRIRQLKQQQGGKLQQPITVMIRGGTYYLDRPVVFSVADSGTKQCPIIYQAYQKERPIISGGKLITGWRQQDQLWIAPVAQDLNCRLLRVGNKWGNRARYPSVAPQNSRTKGWLHLENRGSWAASVTGIHHQGDRLSWEVKIPQAGKYYLWLYYAHYNQIDAKTAIEIDYQTIPLQNLPSTGSWQEYQWRLVTTLNLTTGQHLLTWKNLQGGGINLNAFYLTRVAAEVPSLTTETSNKTGMIIHAETYTNAIAKDLRIDSNFADHLPIAKNQFPQWQSWEGGEIHSFMKHNYGNAIFPITQADAENSTLKGNFVNHGYTVGVGNRFFIENVKEALDSPNEWYLDRQLGELLYYGETENTPPQNVVAPMIDRLLILQGEENRFVEYLTFDGLTFRDTDYNLADNFFVTGDGGLWLSYSRYCTISNCTFSYLGGNGIRVDHQSHHNQILYNQIFNLGQGGIIFVADDTPSQPHSNLIAANTVHDCGKIYRHVAGVYLTSSSKNVIVNNHIYKMPRYGISLKSYSAKNYSHGNIVEYNRIENTNLETSDTGAIEVLGRDKKLSKNIIRFNFIANVVGMGTSPQGEIISPYYTWGIYLDDYSSGISVYGNIIVNTVNGAIMIHGGKDNAIKNNIFVNGVKSQVGLRPRDDFMKNNTFERNIFVYQATSGKLWENRAAKPWKRSFLGKCNHNLYWHQTNSKTLKKLSDITPQGNWRQWLNSGCDRNSLITNPLFINANYLETNPQINSFKLQPNSPAYQLGFKNIPLEKIGISGFNQNNYRG